MVSTTADVPTTGAVARLYSFTNAAAAPVLEITIPYSVPAAFFTSVELVVAAELTSDVVGVAGVAVVVPAEVNEPDTG